MNNKPAFVAWQPVLTDHQAYTLEALARQSGWPLVCMVLQTEDPVRKAQGWLDTQVTSIERRVLPPSLNWLGLWRLLRSQRDAIHLFGSPFEQPRMMRALFLAALMGLDFYLISEPYSTGNHGYFSDRQRWSNRLKAALRPWIYRGYSLTVGRRALGIFAISALAVSQYRRGGVRRERLMPFGYFVPRAADASPTQSPAEPAEPAATLHLVFVGSLIRRKGVDLLITAVQQLRAEGLDVQLDAYGPGSTDGLGFDGVSVRHCGSIAFGQAQQTIAGYDTLVLPSHYDGWGVVVNEALLAGVPVVCSDAVGAKALVETYKAGAVFPSGDTAALASCLRALLQNPSRLLEQRQAAMRAAAAITPDAAAGYMWTAIRQRHEALPLPASPWYHHATD